MRPTRLLQSLIKRSSVTLDIEVGDVLLVGRYKNKPIVVDELGTDDLGQPTVNGRKLLTCRINKLLPPGKRSKKHDKKAALALSLRRTFKAARRS